MIVGDLALSCPEGDSATNDTAESSSLCRAAHDFAQLPWCTAAGQPILRGASAAPGGRHCVVLSANAVYVVAAGRATGRARAGRTVSSRTAHAHSAA